MWNFLTTNLFHIFIMPQNQLRWSKNNQESQFIVRKLIEGTINLDQPDYKKFVREFPNFGKYNKHTFQQNCIALYYKLHWFR